MWSTLFESRNVHRQRENPALGRRQRDLSVRGVADVTTICFNYFQVTEHNMASRGPRRLFSLLRALAVLGVVVLFILSIGFSITLVSDSLDEEVDDDGSDDEAVGDTGSDNNTDVDGTGDTGSDNSTDVDGTGDTGSDDEAAGDTDPDNDTDGTGNTS